MDNMEDILVFGRGSYYKKFSEQINQEYRICGFVDNNIASDESALNPQRDIEKIRNSRLLIMVYRFPEVVYQLLALGVMQEQIVLGTNKYPYNFIDEERTKYGRYIIKNNMIYFASDYIKDNKIFGYNDCIKVNTIISQIMEKEKIPFSTDILSTIPQKALNNNFGASRGTTICRYYIDQFLTEYKYLIRDSVMEIGDNQYTIKYGEDRLEKSTVLSVVETPGCIKGDLQTGEGLLEESVDCFILTQVLDHIYDLKSACTNIVKSLKSGGTALITVSGIGQIARTDMNLYGEYWFFTDMCIQNLFQDLVGKENVTTKTYGNLKASIAKLIGLSAEEISREDLDFCDRDYQILVTAVVRKK